MMPKVFAQITMSLDGFTAGPNDGPEHPLGEGGMALHRWILDAARTPIDEQVAADMTADAGAFVIGRRMADIGIPIWGDDGAFGKPCVVVTHRPAPTLVKGPTTFTFATDGLERALTAAFGAARGKDICMAGGATLIREALAQGVLDELRLSIAPIILGGGITLFDKLKTTARFTPTRVLESPMATHITYRVDG